MNVNWVMAAVHSRCAFFQSLTTRRKAARPNTVVCLENADAPLNLATDLIWLPIPVKTT